MRMVHASTCLLIAIYCATCCGTVDCQEYPVKPDEEHKILKADVGVWDATINMFMEGPEADATSSTGVERVRMHGDFWAVYDLEYEFMGQKTYGHGLRGYDPSLKKYVGNWHESGSPYMSTMEGSYDKGTKTMTMLMKGKDAEGNDVDYKVVTKTIDEDSRSFELHMKIPGSDDFMKILLIEYTKRKSD